MGNFELLFVHGSHHDSEKSGNSESMAASATKYKFAADSFHTNKLCSTLSSREVYFLYENDEIIAFEAPWGLRGNVAVHLRLLLSSYLLVIIELFSLAPTVEPLRANIE